MRSTDDLAIASTDSSSFEAELAWCIQQLQIGLSNSVNSKRGKEQEEAVKVLKILKSSSAPLPKKRCAMKMAFGDYRKKMESGQKEVDLAWKRTKITTINTLDLPSHTYIKRCSSSSTASPASVSDPQNSISAETENRLSAVTDSAQTHVNGGNTGSTSGSETSESVAKSSVNKASGGFKFDFDVDGL